MREEHRLNKAIKKDGIDTQSEILEGLKCRYPQYAEQSDAKKASVNKRRVAVISSFAAVAASVAIIVPCAVLLPNKVDDGNNTYRYCAFGEYGDEASEYTLREYSENSSGTILYFDWYDTAEDFLTTCYIRNDDKELLCVEEYGFLAESDELIYLSVTKSNVYLSMFDLMIKDCKSEQLVNNHNVKWAIKEEGAQCILEDSGYRYFIRIADGQDENRLFELVAELLEAK